MNLETLDGQNAAYVAEYDRNLAAGMERGEAHKAARNYVEFALALLGIARLF